MAAPKNPRSVSPAEAQRIVNEWQASPTGGLGATPGKSPGVTRRQDPMDMVLAELSRINKKVEELSGFIEYAASVSPEVKAYMAGYKAKARMGVK